MLKRLVIAGLLLASLPLRAEVPKWQVTARVETQPLAAGDCSWVSIDVRLPSGKLIPLPDDSGSVGAPQFELTLLGAAATQFKWARNTPGSYNLCAVTTANVEEQILVRYPRQDADPKQVWPNVAFEGVLRVRAGVDAKGGNAPWQTLLLVPPGASRDPAATLAAGFGQSASSTPSAAAAASGARPPIVGSAVAGAPTARGPWTDPGNRIITPASGTGPTPIGSDGKSSDAAYAAQAATADAASARAPTAVLDVNVGVDATRPMVSLSGTRSSAARSSGSRPTKVVAYYFTLLSAPDGYVANAGLSVGSPVENTLGSLSFLPNMSGPYVVQLVVADQSFKLSTPVSQSFTVRGGAAPPPAPAPQPVPAESSAAILGEIRCFAYARFLPPGWAPLDGRTLSINDNQALFSLIGTTYGGDGQSTFALPVLPAPFAGGSCAIAQNGVWPSQQVSP